MKKLVYVLLMLVLLSCGQDADLPATYYECQFAFPDSSLNHPKAAIYQDILDRNRKKGIIGAAMMVKDADGVWLGSSGKADLSANVDVAPCNRFLIASISKSFTATTIFKLVDQGLLTINDPVNRWISREITDNLANANESTVKQLLNHTSGIPDYITLQYDLDRINVEDNKWRQEDILKYAYGKKATHNVGETYYYSNTNYLLLGMIIEKVSGLILSKAYKSLLFSPLGLESAHYSTTHPIPTGTVKGYIDLYGNGQYAESQFLYEDELNTGDGGIAINAYDLGVFFESLLNGKVVSSESLEVMTTYEDLPSDWVDEDFGHFKNGHGLEYNKTPYGNSVGHTGGIDGFASIAQYFPEQNATFILLINNVSYDDQPRLNIYRETLQAMFE